MAKYLAGAVVSQHTFLTIHSERVVVPDTEAMVHLQFRRFAGCPVCDLHLRSIVQRHREILAASIREVVVFHTSAEELLRYAGELPFAIIADPQKTLYEEFGVESRPRALLDPRAWIPIVRGVLRSLGAVFRGHAMPPVNPRGGRFGLPADFLIAPDGRVLSFRYGAHAYDQWSVDDLLALSRSKGVHPLIGMQASSSSF